MKNFVLFLIFDIQNNYTKDMKSRKRRIIKIIIKTEFVPLLIYLIFNPPAYSKDLSISGYFQNFAIFKTDKDTDPSSSIYEPSGQTSGTLGTYAEPRLKLTIGSTSAVIEPLLGFNLWSRNSPFSRPDEKGGNPIIFFLRQLYSETDFQSFSIRAGYQYFSDPIGIFVRHWIGGANFKINKFRIFIGQIPDQTFEGVLSNNLINDNYIFSIDFIQNRLEEDINVLPVFRSGVFIGLYNILDNSVIRKPLFLSTLVSGYSYDTENLNITIGIAAQGGIGFKRAENLQSENIISGAVELSFVKKGENPFGGEVMILSPDNTKYRDNINTAFFYSGKSLSRTIILTEDEIIFKSDNIDLNIGEKTSSFQNIRTGFFLIDIWTDIGFSENWKITPVLGGAFSLINSPVDESLLGRLFGVEISPILSYIKEKLVFNLANTIFIPGYASTVFLNSINPYKKREFIWSIETSFKIIF